MKERDDTRERFLSAISEKLPPDKVVEVHLFQAIKQGGTESGVAVVAVQEEPLLTADAAGSTREAASPRDAGGENELAARHAYVEDRLAVYTARYRLTQKGPERGKWEFALQVEADAPLVTVDKVVQGVQRRSGDADEPERLSGEQFRESVRSVSA